MEKEILDHDFDDIEEVAEILMEDFAEDSKNHRGISPEDDLNDETLPSEFNIKKPAKPAKNNDYEPVQAEIVEENELIIAENEYVAVEESDAPEQKFEILSAIRALNTFDQEDDDVLVVDQEFEEINVEQPMKSKVFSASLQENTPAKPVVTSGNADVLQQICWTKREHIARQKEIVLESKLREMIYSVSPVRGFAAAINSKIAVGQDALIAEIKKASPSRGVIRPDFEPATIAKAYEAGGATCISVLTDTPYFQGRDEYLNIVHRASTLPILRKDFILDPYQVVESRALGADCILLIMAALSDDQAIELEAEAIALGLDVLAEVHDEEELERALKLKTMLIGINNRNLKTLEIDLKNSERLSKLIPFPRTVVCESGIYSYDDIVRMNKSNIKSFLVGESLMIRDDIKAATEKLLGNVL